MNFLSLSQRCEYVWLWRLIYIYAYIYNIYILYNIYIYLCGTKLPTKELLTWNRGSFAEDNKVKCMFVYELYNKPNIKMQYNNMYTSEIYIYIYIYMYAYVHNVMKTSALTT